MAVGRTLVRTVAAICALGLIWIASASLLVKKAARGRTYSDVGAIPARRVGLVLGCSRLLPDGRRNGFFDNRIQAATSLIRAGKVGYLVVSGDNHVRGYDEPEDMKDSLVQAGVPAARITATTRASERWILSYGCAKSSAKRPSL
jgi:SanA protein